MIIFTDVDDTIAESTKPIDLFIASQIKYSLSRKANIHVFISGSTCEQILNQIEQSRLIRLNNRIIHILGTSGAAYQIANIVYEKIHVTTVYTYVIDASKRAQLVDAFRTTAEHFSIEPETDEQDQIQDRLTQVTFSALGRHANPDNKQIWDPDGSYRREIIKWMLNQWRHFEDQYTFNVGGTTSIDVLPKGFSKKTGIEKWMQHNGMPDLAEMIFIGDHLEPGGNDASVRELLLPANIYQVNSLDQTYNLFDQLLDE